MSERNERLEREAEALWEALLARPAPPDLKGGDLIDTLLARTEIARYERLHSRHLRPGAIAYPEQARRQA